MNSSVAILVLVLGLLKVCSSYPAERKLYKERIPIPLLFMNFPLEVDEPKNTIEYLSGTKPNSLMQVSRSKNKRDEITSDDSGSCCPTIVEMIEPLGGKNKSGDLVELYQGDGVRQRFYEVSCSPSALDKHCRFIDTQHKARSKCVQQYSFTYALVRDFGVSYDDSPHGGWRLDYIQVRSGCSCHISPSTSTHRHSSHRL